MANRLPYTTLNHPHISALQRTYKYFAKAADVLRTKTFTILLYVVHYCITYNVVI